MTTLIQKIGSAITAEHISRAQTDIQNAVTQHGACKVVAALYDACCTMVVETNRPAIGAWLSNNWNRVANLADTLATRLVVDIDADIYAARRSNDAVRAMVLRHVQIVGVGIVADAIKNTIHEMRVEDEADLCDLGDDAGKWMRGQLSACVRQLRREEKLLTTFVDRVSRIDTGR